MAESEIELKLPYAIYQVSVLSVLTLFQLICITNHSKSPLLKTIALLFLVGYRSVVWTRLGWPVLLSQVMLIESLTWVALEGLHWKVRQASFTRQCFFYGLFPYFLSSLSILAWASLQHGSCLPLVEAEVSRSWQASYTSPKLAQFDIWCILWSKASHKASPGSRRGQIDSASWVEQHVQWVKELMVAIFGDWPQP